EVTHLSSAKPSPRAGIARKSPFGGESRYTLAGIAHSPRAWRSKATAVRSIASSGLTAASTAPASRTGTSDTAPEVRVTVSARLGRGRWAERGPRRSDERERRAAPTAASHRACHRTRVGQGGGGDHRR